MLMIEAGRMVLFEIIEMLHPDMTGASEDLI
jgi:hypothetical protein